MLPINYLNKFGTKLLDFPRWSLVALAARSCQREPQVITGLSASYLFSPTQDPELFKRSVLIRAAEACAAGATMPNRDIFEQARRTVLFPGKRQRFPLGVRMPQMPFDQNSAVDWLMSAAGRPDVKEAKHDALRSITLSFANARLLLTQKAILSDVQKLHRSARVHKWDDDSAVPVEFFATRLDFRGELSLIRGGICEVVTSVSTELTDFLIHNPQAMYGLKSRQFEEFLAEIFSRRGYEVELTLPTRDKGFDIVAVKCAAKPIKILIECKRYHPSNTVGIDIVQRLYGVTIDNKAQKGVIATTSYFTEDAKEVLRRHPKLLVPLDFNKLVNWLKETDALFLQSRAGATPNRRGS